MSLAVAKSPTLSPEYQLELSEMFYKRTLGSGASPFLVPNALGLKGIYENIFPPKEEMCVTLTEEVSVDCSLDNYALSLLASLKSDQPLERPEHINQAASRVINSLPESIQENVDDWSERLAHDMAKFSD